MLPTAARIVLFRPPARLEDCHGTDPMPAILTRVHEDGSVNLRVFWDSEEMTHFERVPYSEPHEPGTWFWPPRAPQEGVVYVRDSLKPMMDQALLRADGSRVPSGEKS